MLAAPILPLQRALSEPRALVASAAASAPSLLAYDLSPSPTYLNQALAFTLWAVFVIVSAPARLGRGPWAVWAALVLLGAAALWSWGPGPCRRAWRCRRWARSSPPCWWPAALVRGRGPTPRCSSPPFCWAWVTAGVANIALALVQVFVPELLDVSWIAASGIPGRGVGNLRQPNQLSSLLRWHCIAVLALLELALLLWAP